MGKKEKKEVTIAKKILGFLPGILYNILIIFCVILIAIIVMQRFTDSNKSIGGYRIFKVVSGSMVPKYDIGEVVICKDTPVEEIKVGQAIVYRGKIGELNNKIVMHEVVAINYDENNEIKFYAKGLNNSKGDPEISEDQIMGVVKVKSYILSLLYQLATSFYSSFIIIIILVINVFVSFKSGKIEESPEEDNEENKNIVQTENKQEVELNKTAQNIQENENNIEKNNYKNLEEFEKRLKADTNRSTIQKNISNKENVVIDSKNESDKIENKEDSKTANVSEKKSRSKTASSSTKTGTKATSKKTTTTRKTTAGAAPRKTTKKSEAKKESSAKAKSKKE